MRSNPTKSPASTLWSCVLALSIAFAVAGCETSSANGHFGRHFEAETLSGSLANQWDRSDRRIPEFALLAAVPPALASDSDFTEDSPHDIRPSEKTASDGIPILLGLGSLAIGAYDWSEGDRGQSFEASSEALFATASLTQLLKKTTRRSRPDGSSRSSFPSGHTSFAFAATTLILRQLDDENDTSWNPYEPLAYIPALFVATERVRSDKHWTSDVAVGAFLGTFITNWIWDAHFAREDENRRTVFLRERKLAWRWSAGSVDGSPAFGVEFSF